MRKAGQPAERIDGPAGGARKRSNPRRRAKSEAAKWMQGWGKLRAASPGALERWRSEATCQPVNWRSQRSEAAGQPVEQLLWTSRTVQGTGQPGKRTGRRNGGRRDKGKPATWPLEALKGCERRGNAKLPSPAEWRHTDGGATQSLCVRRGRPMHEPASCKGTQRAPGTQVPGAPVFCGKNRPAQFPLSRWLIRAFWLASCSSRVRRTVWASGLS